MLTDRRAILASLAAIGSAGLFPDPIARALALPATGSTGTIADVEHVVILMQENRSFDHYFGTLRGVRGFGDPRPAPLASGVGTLHQPAPEGDATVLPFHLDSDTTSAPVMDSLDHSWKGDAAEWARWNCWIRHKTALTMGHFKRGDIPFYHALADAFTIGDAYHCSIHGPTGPNRLFLFSGTSGLGAGDHGAQAVDNIDDGNWTGDSSRDKAGFAAFTWTTYPQRLDAAGVSWKLYQEYDNFGDNPLALFGAFRGLDPDHPLHRRGRTIVPGSHAGNAPTTDAQPLVDTFAADVAAGRLPQVSWIVAPESHSEHPKAAPAAGESLVSRLLAALTANPAVWGRTAFIIDYDENDGFFDHVPPPLPATGGIGGRSWIDTTGEDYRGQAVGLGPRVPLLIVSPWTRGGWVNSQLFDHTSVIRFLERRFGVVEPNITPWRRAVAGDLTSMFDFASPDASAIGGLTLGRDYLARTATAARRPPPRLPARQTLPTQEPGQRPARALPYRPEAHGRLTGDGDLVLTLVNEGTVAAVFAAYAPDGDGGPWHFTVPAGSRCPASLPARSLGPGGVELHGPNGFLRGFSTGAGPADALMVEIEASGPMIRMHLRSTAPDLLTLELTPGIYGGQRRSIALPPGATRTIGWPTEATSGWYDLTLHHAGSPFFRRFAGHVERSRPSLSDPAFGRSGPSAA